MIDDFDKLIMKEDHYLGAITKVQAEVCENILKSGPVTVNSRVVIQIWAGNLVFGVVIQLPPCFIFRRGNYKLWAVIWFLPQNNKNGLMQFTGWCKQI